MVLKDSFGRPLLNLRVAITQKCNLNCAYCHREGEERNSGNAEIEMTASEIVHIVEIAAQMGISKVKLTGGEPLMRKDLTEIVKGIADIEELDDLSITTNGTLLGSLAQELYSAGVDRINVNLPTLQEETYHKLTGGKLEDALDGIKAATAAGFFPVKINMLVLRGVNDNTISEMIEFARQTRAILQLIELEPVNITSSYYSLHHRPLDEYEDALKEKAERVENRRYMQNRRIYDLPDVKVEVIRPIENTDFCMHCTRLRVTSDGKIKPCLMRNDNLVDVLAPLRNNQSIQKLKELFEIANMRRQPFNTVNSAVSVQ